MRRVGGGVADGENRVSRRRGTRRREGRDGVNAPRGIANGALAEQAARRTGTWG